MNDEKIYLRVLQDDKGVKVVDQHGREVAFVTALSSHADVDALGTATVTFHQAKSQAERLINGMFEDHT